MHLKLKVLAFMWLPKGSLIWVMVLNTQRNNLTTSKKHYLVLKHTASVLANCNVKKILNTQKYFKYFSNNSPHFRSPSNPTPFNFELVYDSNDLQALFYLIYPW